MVTTMHTWGWLLAVIVCFELLTEGLGSVEDVVETVARAAFTFDLSQLIQGQAAQVEHGLLFVRHDKERPAKDKLCEPQGVTKASRFEHDEEALNVEDAMRG